MESEQRYVYRTQREDGAVRRRYVGTADSLAAEEYRQSVELRRKRRQQIVDSAAFLEILESASRDLSELEAQAMRERGYEQNEQRKWKPCKTQ
jgi:hypothetical protein